MYIMSLPIEAETPIIPNNPFQESFANLRFHAATMKHQPLTLELAQRYGRSASAYQSNLDPDLVKNNPLALGGRIADTFSCLAQQEFANDQERDDVALALGTSIWTEYQNLVQQGACDPDQVYRGAEAATGKLLHQIIYPQLAQVADENGPAAFNQLAGNPHTQEQLQFLRQIASDIRPR